MQTASGGNCKISFPTSIIAVIDAASRSRAVAFSISPLAAGLLALCYRIWCRIERLWIWIRIGNGPRYGLRVQSPAVALAIDPIA